MDDQQSSNPDATYTEAEFAAQAENLGIHSYDVAGIFRQAGKDSLTEAEFRSELASWRGEGESK